MPGPQGHASRTPGTWARVALTPARDGPWVPTTTRSQAGDTVLRVPCFASDLPFELLVGESPAAIVGRTPGVVALPDDGREPWVRPGWRGGQDVDALLDVVRAQSVTRLALRGLLVDDDVLAGVATLPGLEALALDGCVLVSDAGLRALARLPRLATLELRGLWQRGDYDGGITSAGLEGLAALPRLTRIAVSPWEYEKRHHFTWFRLEQEGQPRRRVPHPGDQTELDDSVARALAGCRGLVDVRLDRAGALTAAGLAQLTSLPALAALTIDGNSALGPGDLACLRHAPRLRSLGLRNCHGLADADLVDLAALTDLEQLSLQFSGLGDAGIRHLAPLQRLRTLDLFFNHRLGERSLDTLTALAGLELLNLGLTMDSLGDAGITALARMDRLTHLDLGYMRRPLTDASLAALGGCASLESLALGSAALTDAGVARLAGAERLRRLELWDPAKLTDPSLVTIGRLSSLTSLWLGDIGKVTHRGLAALAALPHLGSLGLRTPGLDDDGLRALARAPALRSLFLDNCARVTDAGVTALTGLRDLRCLRLHSLDHHPSRQITDRGLQALATLPHLAGLELDGVAGATHESIIKLLAHPSLVRIKAPRLPPEQDAALHRALAAHPWGAALTDDDTPWPS